MARKTKTLTEQCRCLSRIVTDSVSSVAINRGGQVLVGQRTPDSGPATRYHVSLYPKGGKEPLWSHEAENPQHIALGDDGTAYVGYPTWDGQPGRISRFEVIVDGQLTKTVELPFEKLSAMTLSPDGRTLAVVGQGRDQAPRLYDVSDLDAEPFKASKGCKGKMRHLSFSPDGRWLLSAGHVRNPAPASSFGVRDPRKKRVRWKGIGDQARLLPDDRVMTWTREDGCVLWSLSDETNPLHGFGLGKERNEDDKIASILGGRYFLVSRFEALTVIDLQATRILHTLRLWADIRRPPLTTSPDGEYVALVGLPFDVLVYEASALVR